jgi:AmmeMemoRadiSam system protein A
MDGENPTDTEPPGSGRYLSEADRQALLRLARQTLVEFLDSGRTPATATDSQALREKRATFVTLTVRETGELRGCRGEVAARQPLIESVVNMAVASATDDPRFPPVALAEVPGLHIEISVLTPLRPINPDDVSVGKHGLMISKGRMSGLLLPQVPVEWNWDREEFLESVCRKAGLPQGTWRDPEVQLFGFQCEVWGEEE